MIGILNTGIGNFRSVQNMLNYLGYSSSFIHRNDELKDCKVLIIPGVGHFSKSINFIRTTFSLKILNEIALEKKIPILGICLGMQLMTNYSYEGNLKGLGWVDAKVVKINNEKKDMIYPHMGWNKIIIKKKKNYFLNDINKFYFVHSYVCACKNEEDILTTTIYSGTEFVSSYQKENLTGVQFHPEKSHNFGKYFFKEYLKENYENKF